MGLNLIKRISAIVVVLFFIAVMCFPVSAATHPSGVSMTVSGLTQNVVGVKTTTASSGKYVYGAYEAPPLNSYYLQYYPYVVITKSGDYLYVVYSDQPLVCSNNAINQPYTPMTQASLSTTVYSASKAISASSWGSVSKRGSYTNQTNVLNHTIVWANFDLYHYSSGALFQAAMPYGSTSTEVEHTFSFPSSGYTSVSLDGGFTLTSPATSLDMGADTTVSYSYDSPYVDITFPASVVGLDPSQKFDTLVLNGGLEALSSVGLSFLESGSSSPVYVGSDIYPYQMEILVDGVPVGDPLSLVGAGYDSGGYRTGSLSDLSVSSSYQFSEPLKLSVSSLETVGVRFHLVSASGSSTGTTGLTSPISSGTASSYVFIVPQTLPEFSLVDSTYVPDHMLTVNWVDEDGAILHDTLVESIKEGTAYTTEQKSFDGYTLKEITGDAASGVMDGDKIVTYVYAVEVVEPPDPGPSEPVDPNGPEMPGFGNGLLQEVQGVFTFLHHFYSALPFSIKCLVMLSFGGVVYLSLFKSIWR